MGASASLNLKMAKSRHKAGRRNSPDLVIPTLERAQHDFVERVPTAIADGDGRPSAPFRSIDILGAMLKRGSISIDMHNAGREFQRLFRLANLDTLQAAGFEFRIANSRTDRGTRIERASDQVWRAILNIGGLGSPGGSCVWHVLGWEQSLKAWAIAQAWSGRQISQETASGILISALGALSTTFSLTNQDF